MKALRTGFCVFVLTGGTAAMLAQSNSPACNDELIKGNFGFVVQGTKLGGLGPTGPQVGVAMADFDGKGNLTQTDTVTIDGIVVADFTHSPATGTYKVNPNCTGSFTLDFTDGRPTVTTAFVVVSGGAEIDAVVTTAGGAQGILATGSVGKRRFSTY
jgi:hypothetical protein